MKYTFETAASTIEKNYENFISLVNVIGMHAKNLKKDYQNCINSAALLLLTNNGKKEIKMSLEDMDHYLTYANRLYSMHSLENKGLLKREINNGKVSFVVNSAQAEQIQKIVSSIGVDTEL